MVPRSTIHKWKRKFFALASISSYLPPPLPTLHKTILKCLKCSNKKCSGDTRSSSSSYFSWKKWQSYVRLSMQLRKQEGKQRQRPGRNPREKELQRRRRRRREHWSISNNSEMRCQRKMLPFWRVLKDPSTRKLPLQMRRGKSPPRRLKESNKKSITGAPQSRWGMLTPMRGV